MRAWGGCFSRCRLPSTRRSHWPRLGLAVNLVSAWLLHEERPDGASAGHRHPHGHEHAHHDHHHPHDHHADHNLRAAYVHIMADAAVSVLAVIGLTAGRVLGWVWLDP